MNYVLEKHFVYFKIKIFWPCHTVYRTLVPRPEFKPSLWQWKYCLSYWTTREFPRHFKRNKIVKSCSALLNFIFWLPFNSNDQHLNKKRICPSIEVFASLMVQLVKNPPAMQETWVWSLGQEDPLDLPTSIFWLGEFQGVYSPWNCKELDMTEQLSLSFFCLSYYFTLNSLLPFRISYNFSTVFKSPSFMMTK